MLLDESREDSLKIRCRSVLRPLLADLSREAQNYERKYKSDEFTFKNTNVTQR